MAFKWFKKGDNGAEDAPAPPENDENRLSESDSGSETETDTPGDPAPGEPAPNEPVASESAPSEPVGTDSEGKGSSGLVGRLKKGLSKTREILTTDIDDLFTGNRKLDEKMLEELEELLITADIGVRTTGELIERLGSGNRVISNAAQLKAALKAEILGMFPADSGQPTPITEKPHVMMVVGVNGVGKTTTIGKLAAKFAAEGKGVVVAASDTFRAAASDQLQIWADRTGARIVRHKSNADPAAVAFDGIETAIARNKEIVIVDTAGRLHTKVNLMEELKKIKRTIKKKIPDAPHEVLLILDATTGQNALSQAALFHEAVGVTGIVLAKLDGTARGGIAVSICNTLDIPLRYIGIGENVEDLQVFKTEEFVNALL